jgi:hypothetical protein
MTVATCGGLVHLAATEASMRAWGVAVALLLAAAGGATRTEAAIVFPFEGHGTFLGAAAPVPLTWQVFDNPGAFDFWGISTTTWPSSTSVTDLHVSFTGRTIHDAVGDTGTELRQVDEGATLSWTRVISADKSSVDFFAPPGVSLDQGESFGVAIRWVEDASAVRDFAAHWTTSIPEPATLTLLGTGVLALYAVRRRRV